jgi:hypothetical protein
MDLEKTGVSASQLFKDNDNPDLIYKRVRVPRSVWNKKAFVYWEEMDEDGGDDHEWRMASNEKKLETNYRSKLNSIAS